MYFDLDIGTVQNERYVMKQRNFTLPSSMTKYEANFSFHGSITFIIFLLSPFMISLNKFFFTRFIITFLQQTLRQPSHSINFQLSYIFTRHLSLTQILEADLLETCSDYC